MAPGRKAFEWVGGAPALDFANTVSWTPAGLKNERLTEYADLLGWLGESGLVDRTDIDRTRTAGAPGRAEAALRRAHRLRAILHQVLLAAAGETEPPPEVTAAFNSALSNALRRLTLRPEGHDWGWDWRHDRPADPADLLHPITWSAAGLLTSADRPLLRRCAAETCGWLFLDRSRNHSRRWCDMKLCGNTAKTRRFSQRHRAGSGG